MSKTPKKRVNKTKEELTEELLDQKAEAFKTELLALEDKYSVRIQPQLHFSPKGIIPTLIVMPVEKQSVEVKKEEAPTETKEEVVL